MIYTITLNPAIDKTILVPELKIDHVNRAESYRMDVGGKGINVSKALKSLETESVVCTILGGNTGKQIISYLKENDMNYFCVEEEILTRTNLKIVDSINHTFTDINEIGGPYKEHSYNKMEQYLDEHMKAGDILVLSGSHPSGCDVKLYAHWCKRYKEKNIKVILDGSGDALCEGIKEGPYYIKPNKQELEQLCSRTLEDKEDIIFECKKLIDYGISKVLVSLSSKGALLVTKKESYFLPSIQVTVKSTVGAGDSMVAAICYGIENNLSDKDILSLAIATATASVASEGTSAPKLEEIKRYL